jgi:hypothetical protein
MTHLVQRSEAAETGFARFDQLAGHPSRAEGPFLLMGLLHPVAWLVAWGSLSGRQ